MWTVFWIYLTIDSWKVWGWKALIPYPIFLIAHVVLWSILMSQGPIEPTIYIMTLALLNIGDWFFCALLLIELSITIEKLYHRGTDTLIELSVILSIDDCEL
jgi:hypothetical protein